MPTPPASTTWAARQRCELVLRADHRLKGRVNGCVQGKAQAVVAVIPVLLCVHRGRSPRRRLHHGEHGPGNGIAEGGPCPDLRPVQRGGQQGGLSRVWPASGSAAAHRNTDNRVPEFPRASSIAAWPAQPARRRRPAGRAPPDWSRRRRPAGPWGPARRHGLKYRLVPVSPSATGKILMALRRSLWFPRTVSALPNHRFIACALAAILVCKVVPSPGVRGPARNLDARAFLASQGFY